MERWTEVVAAVEIDGRTVSERHLSEFGAAIRSALDGGTALDVDQRGNVIFATTADEHATTDELIEAGTQALLSLRWAGRVQAWVEHVVSASLDELDGTVTVIDVDVGASVRLRI